MDQVTGSAAVRILTPDQEDAITRIAALPPGVGRHAAFLRCVLGERSYFEIALMSRWLKEDPPLTADEMRYIAERWHADAN